ncbi:MAG: S-methyl-5-thioribose-1-phosphate isomerase, partial [Candidatus Omnitrophica bacterium]|nr:S-methyl-5-thioribose-1-phosphate isomerase [Candidatus Omnitrophota bacterium]MBD3269644.1 S-methyl-5-thioribose-1-phosphate isomerase [Candidatus Omnitrophota bacterium]
MRAVKFENKHLFYLDQTELPSKEVWRECRGLKEGFEAIKTLRVRGAPLIGVFAAYCLSLHLDTLPPDKGKFLKEFHKASKYLESCRPTAVNLSWALGRIKDTVSHYKDYSVSRIKREVIKEAGKINKEDVGLCKKMAGYGVKLIKSSDRILTHCNTGFLATSGDGTALAVVYKAHKMRKKIMVYACETRPLLQGARLTAWELVKRRVPSTLICDSAAAYLMKKGKIDKVFLGADRIASNGDTANKIGTYNLAVMANHHKIPFYIVAPFSTFDLNLSSGREIVIEERGEEEVKKPLGKFTIAPESIKVCNPAFDVTPGKLITAIITDKGI